MPYFAGGMQIHTTTSESYLAICSKFGNKHIHDPKGCALEQGSANIFYKGTGDKYFRLCGPRGKIKDI